MSHWVSALRSWRSPRQPAPAPPQPVRIGIALGGGFARGIAHVGLLRVLETHGIPIHCIAGVSAGAIVAAGYASGATADEIGTVGCSMRFTDVARWSICRMGFAGSERMEKFLKKLLKCFRFEEMRIPLGVVATDLVSGQAVEFRESGDVVGPIRASCSYPGLFQPMMLDNRLLVDGAMSMEVPARLTKKLGATHTISVHLPMQGSTMTPRNMFQVVNRCFQVLQARTEASWRADSDLVIAPEVFDVQWDSFGEALQLIQAGERAALAALPQIQGWLRPREVVGIEAYRRTAPPPQTHAHPENQALQA